MRHDSYQVNNHNQKSVSTWQSYTQIFMSLIFRKLKINSIVFPQNIP